MRIITVLIAAVPMLNVLILSAQDEGAAKARVDALVRAVAAGGIERIDIFRLPKGYENVTSIQPEDLEALWHYKMTIREILPPKQEFLAQVVGMANIRRSDRTWDLRWGVVFYWPKDRRIVALYFDETGRHGSVDKIPVSFAPDFFNRLKNTLHLSME
jgi:hypothetical protein